MIEQNRYLNKINARQVH